MFDSIPQTLDDADYVFQQLDENHYEWQSLTDGSYASVEHIDPRDIGWHYSVICTTQNKCFRGYKLAYAAAVQEARFWLRHLSISVYAAS